MCCELVKNSAHVDDQLDVFPAHGLGGTIGTIMTGMLADKYVRIRWNGRAWFVLLVVVMEGDCDGWMVGRVCVSLG